MDDKKIKRGVLSVEEIKKLVKKIYRPDERTQQALLRERQESTSGKKN
jgi:hypothetical protein